MYVSLYGTVLVGRTARLSTSIVHASPVSELTLVLVVFVVLVDVAMLVHAVVLIRVDLGVVVLVLVWVIALEIGRRVHTLPEQLAPDLQHTAPQHVVPIGQAPSPEGQQLWVSGQK